MTAKFALSLIGDCPLIALIASDCLQKVSKKLTQRFGPGLSERTLLKMRQFFLLNPIPPTSAKLGWSHYIELLPVENDKMRKRLEQRALKEDLTSVEIRELVQKVRKAPPTKSSRKLAPLKYPTDLKLHTFSKSTLRSKLKDGDVLIDCGFVVSWPVDKEEFGKSRTGSR